MIALPERIATAAFLFGAGDMIAQQAIEHEGENHDVCCYHRDLAKLTIFAHVDRMTDLLWVRCLGGDY